MNKKLDFTFFFLLLVIASVCFTACNRFRDSAPKATETAAVSTPAAEKKPAPMDASGKKYQHLSIKDEAMAPGTVALSEGTEMQTGSEPRINTTYPPMSIFLTPSVSASFPNMRVVLVRDRRKDSTTRETVLMDISKCREIDGRETFTIYESSVAMNAAKHTLYTMKRSFMRQRRNRCCNREVMKA